MNTILLVLTLLLVSCGKSPIPDSEVEKSFSSSEDTFYGQVQEHHFPNSGHSFSIDWSAPPRTNGKSQFLLKAWNSGSGTLNGPYRDLPHTLHVFLWMPSMGHGSSPVKLVKKAPGVYEVTNVFFIMAGKWEIKFQLLANGKVVDEAVLGLTL